MTVTLTGNGGLFKRFGMVAGALANLASLQGGTATTDVASGASMTTRGTNLETEFLNSPSVSAELDSHWTAISSWRSAQNTLFSSFRSIAEKAWIRQIDLDASLSSKDLTTATTEIIRQMRGAAASVNASTVAAGAQTTVSATGNPVVVVSLKNYQGYTWQTPFAETLRFRITGDYLTGSTARNEPMSVKGAAAIADKFAYNWPGGSGCSVNLNLVDAQSDNSKGNALYNGDFETFTTTNYPDNWVIQTGSVTTNVLSVATPYTGTYALRILGDAGGTLTSVYQEFDHAVSTTAGAGGTPFELEPGTQYAVQFRNRVSSVPGAGVLRVALVDSSGTVINDDSGTANSFTVTLTGLTTSYSSSSGSFRTPTAMPSDGIVRLQLKLTTAISDTVSVYIDDIAFTEMTSLYKGGPSVAAFAGDTKVVTGDNWTVAVTNTMGTMARWLEILYSLNAKELIIPYSGAPTIADSLVS
jgi:hypothetical protein